MRTSFRSDDAPKRKRSGVIHSRPERLVQRDEVLDRLLRRADPAGGLDPDDVPGLRVDVADDLHHAERHGKRGGGADLAGRRLDEVGAGGDGDQRGAAHVVVRPELARLEDDLQVRVAAGLLDADDLVEDLRVAAREERAAVDDHVDLVGAEFDDRARLRDLDVGRRLTGRERGGDGRDLDAAAGEALLRDADEARVDADRRDGGTDTSTGSGRIAFEQSAATFPGVSCPSSVVRSIIRIASSSACTFDSRLIDRFASVAARSSRATASTEPTRGSRGPDGSSKPPTSAGALAMLE